MSISWPDAFATGSRPCKLVNKELVSIHLSIWHTKGSAGSAVGHGTRYFSITSPLVFSILELAKPPRHVDVLVMVPLYKYVASVLSTESVMASSCFSTTPGSTEDISLPWVSLFSAKVVMVKLQYRCGHRCDYSRRSKSSIPKTTC